MLHVVVCPSLSPLTNGMISYSDQTLGLGSVASHICDTWYVINGTATRVCGANGQWTDSSPNCVLGKYTIYSCVLPACYFHTCYTIQTHRRSAHLFPHLQMDALKEQVITFQGVLRCTSVIVDTNLMVQMRDYVRMDNGLERNLFAEVSYRICTIHSLQSHTFIRRYRM